MPAPVNPKSAKDSARRKRRRGLLETCRRALEAWIRADAAGVPEVERGLRLTEARRLTGEAVDAGLLGTKTETLSNGWTK